MKASTLKTYWIILLTLWATAGMCIKTIAKRLIGTTSRQWVDTLFYNWAKRVLALAGVQYQIVNPKNIRPKPGTPTLVMCNHVSLYDIPLSAMVFPNQTLRMLAKKELTRIPLMGMGLKASEFPIIDRKNRANAMKDLEYVQKLLNSGVVMWMSPEGTRSKDGALQPFKKGGFITAIQMKATIIPLVIKGANDILPAKSRQLNLGQKATLYVGDPIDATAYSLDQKEALINKTWNAMNALLNEDSTKV